MAWLRHAQDKDFIGRYPLPDLLGYVNEVSELLRYPLVTSVSTVKRFHEHKAIFGASGEFGDKPDYAAATKLHGLSLKLLLTTQPGGGTVYLRLNTTKSQHLCQ
ncbi:hypothetical protein PM082_007742 [Marasmius tenuissimus]|nr:hypothetical protein PM082_007742 [Marasmius tenuissimus]